jgi:pimeloyl-ACP methyl ester carboxylesterase
VGHTTPFTFGRNAGLLATPQTAKVRSTGVLLCPSWGIDELCARKTFRRISEVLSHAGFPTLRFDYPGTVDSLEPTNEDNLAEWLQAASEAADALKNMTGSKQIVPLGLGLGAIVASRLAEERDDIAGIVLAAPVTSGRRFLRETNIRAKVICEGLGLTSDTLPKDCVSIGGILLQSGVALDLKSAKLDGSTFLRGQDALVIARSAISTDAELAQQLKQSGLTVEVLPFEGYDKLMEDPTASRVPEGVITKLSDWFDRQFPMVMEKPATTAAKTNNRLVTDTFVEEGVVFRTGKPLHGVLCQPLGETSGPVFVLLNSGYDHHGGWARCWVQSSRALAKVGVTSLRFDMANIGDSAPIPGRPDQVLYTEGPITDASDAIDFLQERFTGPITIVGRCSGAYTAFHACYQDPRINRLVVINQLRLIWDPEESITDAARMGPRSMNDYKKKFGDVRTLKRLLSGDINLRGAMRGLAIHGITRASHILAPVLPNLTKHARFRTECHRMFEILDQRDVPIDVICSEGDESLEQLELYFGKNAKGLEKFPSISSSVIKGADHNLTPLFAQAELVRLLLKIAESEKVRLQSVT